MPTHAHTMLSLCCALEPTNIWAYMPSFQLVQTHANTQAQLSTNQHMQMNAQLSIKAQKNANSCSFLWHKPINADTRSSLYTLFSVCAGTSHCIAGTSTAFGACRHTHAHDMTSLQYVQTHALSPQHMHTHADTHKALHTWQHMKVHHWSGWVPTKADTCSAFDKDQQTTQTCGYVADNEFFFDVCEIPNKWIICTCFHRQKTTFKRPPDWAQVHVNLLVSWNSILLKTFKHDEYGISTHIQQPVFCEVTQYIPWMPSQHLHALIGLVSACTHHTHASCEGTFHSTQMLTVALSICMDTIRAITHKAYSQPTNVCMCLIHPFTCRTCNYTHAHKTNVVRSLLVLAGA